ncbi:MAG TPA: hypothetical protein VK574_09930 [Terracidiphilus sp.]|nr:hypothetical protein [Terracidiphilus sp.]
MVRNSNWIGQLTQKPTRRRKWVAIFTFTNEQLNAPIPPATFHFIPPAGVSVVDGSRVTRSLIGQPMP